MLKRTPLLILLVFASNGVVSQGTGGSSGGLFGLSTNGRMSILPFDPIGFTNFIMYMILLPFRILEGIFGGFVGIDQSSNPLGPSGRISILPFDPIGFTNFILYMISLPFRILGDIFGFPLGSSGSGSSGESSSGSEVGNASDSGIFGGFLDLPRGIARFMEEIFHFIRILLDRIFGNLEGGAAFIAGDGPRSQSNRDNRSRNATGS